jgi:hypothetical protein
LLRAALFTTGIAAGMGDLMVPQPMNSNTSQIDARVNYSMKSCG